MDTHTGTSLALEYIKQLHKHWYYADKIRWETMLAIVKDHNRLNSIKEDLQPLDFVHWYIVYPKDKHSYIVPKSALREGHAQYIKDVRAFMPKVKFDPNTITIKLPDFPGTLFKKYGKKYISKVHKVLHNAYKEQVPKIIIDLRDNSGGTEIPMLLSLAPLLPDNKKLMYLMNKNKKIVDYKYIKNNGLYNRGGLIYRYMGKQFKYTPQIELLVNTNTKSAGEITALAFLNLPNAKVKGESGGYLTNIFWGFLTDGTHFGFTDSVFLDSNKKLIKKIDK